MFVIFYLLCAVDDSYDTYSWLRKFETWCSDYILSWGSWEVIQVKATRDTSPPGFSSHNARFQRRHLQTEYKYSACFFILGCADQEGFWSILNVWILSPADAAPTHYNVFPQLAKFWNLLIHVAVRPPLHYSILLLLWRHNGRDSVSNNQPHVCLLNRIFRRRSKKASKLRVTGLCAGISPGTGEFPAQKASYAENVFIWWRHHGNDLLYQR